MIYLVVLAIFAQTVRGQYSTAPRRQQATEGKLVYVGAPLHYVNVGPRLAGDYNFAYDTGKGPTGQSFREEVRLADGSVKGSYGLIDEKGHKGIVRYSTGKSSFNSDGEEKISDSPLSSIRRQSDLGSQLLNFNPFPQQSLVFKPNNYLQSRTVNMKPVPPQPTEFENIASLSYEVPQNVISVGERLTKKTTPSFYRLTTPADRAIVAAEQQPENRLPVPTDFAKPTENRLPVPAELAKPKDRLPVPTESVNSQNSLPVPAEQQVTSPPTTQTQRERFLGVPERRDSIAEMYKSIRRVTKKPVFILPKPQKEMQKVTKKTEERSYDSRTDEDYYDSAPAFIDIERLSYSVGTDKSTPRLRN